MNGAAEGELFWDDGVSFEYQKSGDYFFSKFIFKNVKC